MHALTHTYARAHTHHDALARVKTDNLAKDFGGDGACTGRYDHANTVAHPKAYADQTTAPHFTMLHSVFTHMNTQPLLHFEVTQ